MRKRTLWMLLVGVLVIGPVIHDRITIGGERDRLPQRNTELELAMFTFHNLYTSQMDNLVSKLRKIRDDDYADIKEIYNPEAKAGRKLQAVQWGTVEATKMIALVFVASTVPHRIAA